QLSNTSAASNYLSEEESGASGRDLTVRRRILLHLDGRRRIFLRGLRSYRLAEAQSPRIGVPGTPRVGIGSPTLRTLPCEQAKRLVLEGVAKSGPFRYGTLA